MRCTVLTKLVLTARLLTTLERRCLRWAMTRRHAERTPIGVPHVGADEGFGGELRALRDIEVAPELISDIETELRWGLVWHEFEAGLQAEVDRIFSRALAFADCQSFDEVRDLVTANEG